LMRRLTMQTVTVEPSEEVIEAAQERYDAVEPDGDREEMLKQYVLDLTELEVSLD